MIMKRIALTAMLFTSVFATTVFASQYDKPGFVTEVEDGRLWVFRADSAELKEFKATGEPAKQFTEIGAGPDGMTVKSADAQTLADYLKLIKQ
jgi:hypothetical protein